MVGLCWKKYPHLAKTKSETEKRDKTVKHGKEKVQGVNVVNGDNPTTTVPIFILKRGEANKPKVQKILQEVWLT